MVKTICPDCRVAVSDLNKHKRRGRCKTIMINRIIKKVHRKHKRTEIFKEIKNPVEEKEIEVKPALLTTLFNTDTAGN